MQRHEVPVKLKTVLGVYRLLLYLFLFAIAVLVGHYILICIVYCILCTFEGQHRSDCVENIYISTYIVHTLHTHIRINAKCYYAHSLFQSECPAVMKCKNCRIYEWKCTEGKYIQFLLSRQPAAHSHFVSRKTLFSWNFYFFYFYRQRVLITLRRTYKPALPVKVSFRRFHFIAYLILQLLKWQEYSNLYIYTVV